MIKKILIIILILAASVAGVMVFAPHVFFPPKEVKLSADSTLIKTKIHSKASRNKVDFKFTVSNYEGQEILLLDSEKNEAAKCVPEKTDSDDNKDDKNVSFIARIPSDYMNSKKSVWYVKSCKSDSTKESDLLRFEVRLKDQPKHYKLPVEGSQVWSLVSSQSGVILATKKDTLIVSAGTNKDSKNDTGTEEWSKYETMIDLPSVCPDINYDITNAYSSVFRVQHQDIPGVSGNALYNESGHLKPADAKKHNKKTGRSEFLVPVQYDFAMEIAAAQRRAEKRGWRLHIYDTFRPILASQQVYNAASGFDKRIFAPYGESMFIAPGGHSYHNGGEAVDTSIDVWNKDSKKWEERDFGSPIHELSPESAFASEDLISLFPGCDTIPSEWWHFQSQKSRSAATAYAGNVSSLFVGRQKSLSVPRSELK